MPVKIKRRRVLLGLAGAGALAGSAATSATGLPAVPLRFPRDAGSHNDFTTEWWYLTGYAGRASAPATLGFQLTFFRHRVAATQGLRSHLAARQLLLGHAAVTDVAGKKLWHAQQRARWSGDAPGSNPTDAASASAQDTGVVLQDWSLLRSGGDLLARMQGAQFALDLRLHPTQALLLQGQDGLSRKGPQADQASYYYSLPQLQASGSITLQGRTYPLVPGSTAWLDHEWSQDLLHPEAVGWDWIGINLFDGSALTAFQLRDGAGQALWDGGSFRSAAGVRYVFSRGETQFKPLRYWHSTQSQARYPVQWMVRTAADVYTVQAVLDAQELDARASTGNVYWEGLCEMRDSRGQAVGRGYLEMTGYAAALRL